MLGSCDHHKPDPKSSIFQEFIADTLFLCDTERDNYVHTLNSGAAIIWLLCDGQRSVEDITHEITEAYHLPYSEIHSVVKDTIEQLAALGLFVA